jgi:hypothetical protein
MALLHHAELVPSKLDLVSGWITAQPFWPSGAQPASLRRMAAFRFDDPAGKVGIETLLLQSDAPDGTGVVSLQVPLTYREAPLDGGESAFMGTLEHSVLGTRWVYDATGDPVYVAELVRTVVTGGHEVELYYEENGERVVKEGDAHVRGSGHPDAAVPDLPADAAGLDCVSDSGTTTTTAGDVHARLARILGGTGASGWGAAESLRPDDGDGLLIGGWGETEDVLLAAIARRD